MVGVVLLEDFEDEVGQDGAVGDVGMPVKETASGDPPSDELERDHLDLARPERDCVELLEEVSWHTHIAKAMQRGGFGRNAPWLRRRRGRRR